MAAGSIGSCTALHCTARQQRALLTLHCSFQNLQLSNDPPPGWISSTRMSSTALKQGAKAGAGVGLSTHWDPSSTQQLPWPVAISTASRIAQL